MSVDLVEVVRSGFREGVHRGSLVVLDAGSEVLLSRGEVGSAVFPRSSNKPLQAVGMLRAGFAPTTTAQLALASASHEGEPVHTSLTRAVLAGAGLTEDQLACPAALPGHEPTRDAVLANGGRARPVFMNCSGKHAAMLATCVANGWPVADYPDPEHPLQVSLAATVADLAGEPVAAVGVDGCGAPVLALSLTGLARAFSGLVQAAPGSPQRRVADAVRAHPHVVSGAGREDLDLMTAVPGLLCKAGAEGVHAGALPDGRAFALKVDDGASRARRPVVVGLLRRLGVPDGPQLVRAGAEVLLGGGGPVGAARLLPGVL